jgi:acetyltransferase-like isoleucine patch superfamily enzyme
MMQWSVPKIWPGSTVYLLGGGPSLLNEDLTLIQEERCIGINNSCFLGDWVDVCWFGDIKWWTWHRTKLRDYKGLILTCNKKMRKWKRMKTLARGKPQGIDSRPSHVSWNRNSGASAINLAYHFGADRVVLVGFDMRKIDGKKNWHDDHKEKPHNPFTRHLKPFAQIARDAMELGLEIINVTPGSAIKQFPIMKLTDFVTGKEVPDVVKQRVTRQKVKKPSGTVIRKTSTMEKPREIGQDVFIGHFNVFRANVKIGNRTKIGHHCVFEGDIVVGEDCLIQPQCNITAGTIIEDKVFIGQGVITGNDKRMVHLRRDKVPFVAKAPVFKYGCRIGMGSVILPGVTINRETFVAAGSVVTSDTEPFSLYKGNPARKIDEIPEEEKLP